MLCVYTYIIINNLITLEFHEWRAAEFIVLGPINSNKIVETVRREYIIVVYAAIENVWSRRAYIVVTSSQTARTAFI